MRIFCSRGMICAFPWVLILMLQPLRDHILNLEHRLQALRDELTRSTLTPEDRRRMEKTIRVTELALRHYLKAFELERRSDPQSFQGYDRSAHKLPSPF